MGVLSAIVNLMTLESKKLTVAEGFRLSEIAAWARQHLSPGTQVLCGVEDAADAGAAAQVELGLSGNQEKVFVSRLSPHAVPGSDRRDQTVDFMHEIALLDRLTIPVRVFKSAFQGHGYREGGGDATRRQRARTRAISRHGRDTSVLPHKQVETIPAPMMSPKVFGDRDICTLWPTPGHDRICEAAH